MCLRRAIAQIEVLTFVIIAAVLAGAVISQFSLSNNDDARASSLKFNLRAIRAQIVTYKSHHNGKLPSLETFADQMTKATAPDGRITGPNLTCGPYFYKHLPANSFNGSSAVVAVPEPGIVPKGIVPGGAGWQYDASTGRLYPNNTDYYAK